MIGQQQTLSLTFDNAAATDAGFGPYIDLLLPSIGADGAGAATDDGLTFVSATYLGTPVATITLTCPVAAHPYTGLPVACPAGDQLVVLQLPFGSFTASQPPATISVTTLLSNLADVGTPLTVLATPGFRYGADALDNPGTDPPITGTTQSGNLTPTLLTVTKTYNGPESETATGPNFPRRYTISVDIADGQTITNLDVTDFLPNNLAFLSIVATTPAGAVVLDTPTVGAAANPPNNDLVVRFPAVTGGPGTADATVTFEYFVPQNDANAVPVISPITGDDVQSLNNARGEGDWTPIDARDPPAHPVIDQPGPEHTLTDKSIAIQKSVAIVTDVGAPGASPGDTLRYTLVFQVSDFFTFQNLIVTDTFSDGQHINLTPPTLAVTENGATSSGTLAPANSSSVLNSPGTGTTDLTFRVSDELITRGFTGRLAGGLVPDGGAANDGPTTATITFETTILDSFTDTFPSGNPSLNPGDQLSNVTNVAGDILDNGTLMQTGFAEGDGSTAGVSLGGGTLTKTIYARNGVVGPATQFAPGDTITYRIHFTMRSGDVENMRFDDFLPLPVLVATEVAGFSAVVSAAAPAAGAAKFGPSDTFFALSGITPTVSSDATANLLRFSYGTYDDPTNTPVAVDLLFTVTINTQPFADGLFLTNQVQELENNTSNTLSAADSLVQFQLTEPALRITKGALASTNAAATFAPSTVGPVAFSSPGGACPRFGTTVSTNGLTATPMNSNVGNIDGGDRVTFAIVVENTGNSILGAFDVRLRDSLPSGFSIPGGGLNLCVTDGTGAVIPTTALGSGLFDPLGGIELDDPGPTLAPPGAIDPFDPTNGRNIAVITYDLQADGPTDASPVTPRQVLTNTATLFNYAGAEGGPDFTSIDQTDTASATITTPQIAKSIQAISPNGTQGSSVTAGDVITYALAVTLPEGRTPGLVLSDILPTGFQFIPGSVLVLPGTFNGSLNLAPTVGVAGAPATGQTITLTFGTTDVTADNNGATNTFTVTLQALVLDTAQNNGIPAQTKTNTGRLNFTGNPGGPLSSTASTTFLQPRLTLSKAMAPANPDAGDVVTITLVANNTGTAPAYDVVLADPLPSSLFDLTPVVSVNAGSTPVDFAFSYASPTVTYAMLPASFIAPGGSRSFTFTARVRPDVVTGTTYQNTASVTGDSQSGVVAQQRATTNAGSANVSIPNAGVSKSIVATSENSTDPGDLGINGNPPVAIGEVVTYRVTFTVPEGITNGVILADVLPAGTTLVSGSARLDRTSLLLTSAADPGSINSNSPGSPVAVTLTGSTGEVSLTLGNVVNADMDNTTAEQYLLTLRVVVDNSVTNNAGTSLSNIGRLHFLNAGGVSQQVDSTPRLTHIAEPVVSVDKTANPTSATGGDTIAFTLVVTNSASGTNAASGFDWTISDTLPVQYVSPLVTSVNVGATGATAGAAFVGNLLSGTIDQLDPGESVTITYTAVLGPLAQFGQTVPNIATVNASSLPGSNGTGNATPGAPGSTTGERTATGGANDLTASDPAAVTVGVPTLTKTTLNPQPYYAIGETPQFRISVGAPVGSASNFVITDVLPAGLSFNAGSLVVTLPVGAVAANAPLSEGNAAFFTLVGNNLTFNFGNITVPTAGNIQIAYTTTVRNVIGNQDNIYLPNTASLNFVNAATGTPIALGPVTNDLPVRVGEPNLEMQKQVLAGATNADAGDTVSWRVILQNVGHTTAYRLNWNDVMPNGLYQLSNVVVTPSGGNVFLNATNTPVNSTHSIVSTTSNTNDTVSLPLLQMAPGTTLQIDFDSVVMNTVVPGQVLNNATRANYTSLVGGGRDNSSGPATVDDDNNTTLNNYAEQASQALTIAAPIAIDKTVSPSVYTVGQNVSYNIRVSVVEGTTPGMIVTDVLPAGLTYVSHSIAFGNLGMTAGNASYNTRLGSGQTVQFNFGNVIDPGNSSSSDDFVAITLTARVDNILANQSGTILRNGEQANGSSLTVQYGSTTLNFDHDAGTPGFQGVPISLIEPVLEVLKSADPVSQSLGDIVTYTVQVRHAPSSTADAYDLVLNDVLPPGLTYVPGSATLPAADVTAAGQNLQFRISALTLLAGNTTFTYQATIDLGAQIGAPLTNNVALTWAGIPGATGAPDNGRNGGDGIGGLNDYTSGSSATVTPNENAFIDATKTVIDLNGGEVYPGDILQYTVTLINTSAPVTGVVFTDTVPIQTTYVNGTLSSTQGTTNDSGRPTLRVNVGSMTTGQTVSITFEARVLAGTAHGVVISNQGSVDSNQTVPEPTDVDGNDKNGDQPTDVITGQGIPAHRLRAEKYVEIVSDTVPPVGTINPGDVIRYLITLKNTGASILTNVVFNDTVPSSIAVTAISTTQGTAPPPSNTIFIGDIGTLLPNASVTITVIGTVTGTGTICNQGSGDSLQTSPSLTDNNPSIADGVQPTCIDSLPPGSVGTPRLILDKTYQLIGDNNNSGGPNGGERVRYKMTVQNTGSAMAIDVFLTDPAPANTTIVPGSVITSQGAVVSESPVSVNLGTMAAGQVATVTFDVDIDNAVAAGTRITNTATVTDRVGNTATDSTAYTIQALAIDLAIRKQHSGTFAPGQNGTYTLTVTNVGSLATTGTITVIDTLPTGFSYVSASGGAFACSGASQTMTCVRTAPLPPGSISSILLVVRVDSSASPISINVASVTTDGDGNISNNTATDPTSVSGVGPTPTATPLTPVPSATPTRTRPGTDVTPIPTRTPTGVRSTPTRASTFTPPPTRTRRPPGTPEPCGGNRKFKLLWSNRDPLHAKVIFSATRCVAPPGCFDTSWTGPMTIAPVTLTISDSQGGTLEETLELLPLNQGSCPGGVDSYCFTNDDVVHVDRMHFVYGRDGITTLRGKINFKLPTPEAPTLTAPLRVRVADSDGYVLDILFSVCQLRTGITTTTLQCR